LKAEAIQPESGKNQVTGGHGVTGSGPSDAALTAAIPTTTAPAPVTCTTNEECTVIGNQFCRAHHNECYPCTQCGLCSDGIDNTCGGCDENIYPTDDISHAAGTCVRESRVEVVCSSLGCEECVAAGDHGCAYAGTNCGYGNND